MAGFTDRIRSLRPQQRWALLAGAVGAAVAVMLAFVPFTVTHWAYHDTGEFVVMVGIEEGLATGQFGAGGPRHPSGVPIAGPNPVTVAGSCPGAFPAARDTGNYGPAAPASWLLDLDGTPTEQMAAWNERQRVETCNERAVERLAVPGIVAAASVLVAVGGVWAFGRRRPAPQPF